MKTVRSGRRTRLAALTVLAASLAAACGGGGGGGGDRGGDTTPPGTGGATTTSGAVPPDTTTDNAPATSATGPTRVTVPPDTTPDPVRGGTLRYAIEADVDGLNPTRRQVTAYPGKMMAAAVFDKLFELDTDGNAVPFLAESATPNADFTQWTLKLRPGITFHDDTPFNAEAVQVNFQGQYENGLVGLAVKPFFPETDQTEVVDDLTIVFNLNEPNAQWPALMSSQLGMMASPTWLAAALADEQLDQAPVGTGPFKFESRIYGDSTTFVRNDQWWSGTPGGAPYLDRIEYVIENDGPLRGQMLLKGEVQAIMTDDEGSIADVVEDGRFTAVIDDGAEESFLLLNTERPPFDDIRARQALTLATPRAGYSALIAEGGSLQADQMFYPGTPYHNPAVKQEGDNPGAAAALVADYCAERGNDVNSVLGKPACTDGKINIEYQYAGPDTTNDRAAALFAQGWGDLFNVVPDMLEQPANITQTAFMGTFNVVLWRQFGELNPVLDRVWLLCRTIPARTDPPSGIALNFTRHCDPERDAAILRGTNAADEAERVAAYQEVVQRVHDAYVYVFLNHNVWANFFDQSVKGQCGRTAPDGTELACAIGGTMWPTTMWLEQ